MSAQVMRSFKGLFTGVLAACFSVAMVGCADSEQKVADKGGASKPAAKPAAHANTASVPPIQRVQKKPIGARPITAEPAAKTVTAAQPAGNLQFRATGAKSASPPVRMRKAAPPVVKKAQQPPVPPPVAKNTQPPPVVKKAQQPAAAPKSGGEDNLRQETTDAIYAAIRVRMEQAILKRKALLDAGRDPSDVEVRSLEGQITKARGYLVEAGEEVEDVDPPILTKPKG